MIAKRFLYPPTTRQWMRVFLLTLLLGASSPLRLHAQRADFRFERISIEDGLSQNSIYAIFQDQKGFMWFGTKDGLNKFDGYKFKIYKHNPYDSTSLSHNHVTVIFQEDSGRLWIGSEGGGLSLYDFDADRFHRFVHDPNNPNSLSHNLVTAIAQDQSGAIWVGTLGAGLNRLTYADETGEAHSTSESQTRTRVQNKTVKPNLQFRRFTHDVRNKASLNHDNVRSLIVDDSGALWVATDRGLNRLDLPTESPKEQEFIRFTKVPGEPTSLPDSAITCVYEDRHSTIWLGSKSGLSRLDSSLAGFVHYPYRPDPESSEVGQLRTILEDHSGKLWFGSHYIFGIFDPEKASYSYLRHNPLDPTSISLENILSLYEDRGQVMWVGTSGRGLNKYNRRAEQFHYYRAPGTPTSWSNRSVESIYEDQSGTLWIGADGDLYTLDRRVGELKRFDADFGSGTFAILQDRGGHFWFGSDVGLFRYSPKTESRQFYGVDANDPMKLKDRLVNAIHEDKAGGIWVANGTFLSYLETATGPFVHYSMMRSSASTSLPPVIRCLQPDSFGGFWLGTDDGLVYFDPGRDSVVKYRNDPKDPASLSHNVVLSICADPGNPDKILWIGTAGGGINRLDVESKSFVHFTEEDGLPNNVAYGILDDEAGHFWISTNMGLSKFSPEAQGKNRFRNFTVENGLQSNEFNRGAYFKSGSGELFFGGINGFNVFYPTEIRDNPHIPEIVITDFRILNKPVVVDFSGQSPLTKSITQTDQITVPHRAKVLSFEFVALDFSAPEKNQYAYMMEGFDEDWIESGFNRTATYTNLDPGTYTFRAKGSNDDGVWNEAGTSIEITITPPFWQTWQAYVLYIIITAGALYGFRRYELNRIRLREELKIERVHAEKLQELDKMKSHFFANISHEFRTPLTLILAPLKNLRSGVSNADADRHYSTIERNAHRLLRLINQVLDLSKLEFGKMHLQASCLDVIMVLQGITMSFSSLADKRNISLSFQSEMERLDLYFDQEKFEKIFYNLLSNAFKFTPATGGKIAVVVKTTEQNILTSQLDPDPVDSELEQSPGQVAEFVQVTVRDTGVGIPEEELPHVFDRFYQTQAVNTHEFGGTGIGLSLVKELVELHHGTIRIESEPGWGTQAIVCLPLGRAHLSDDQIVEATDVAKSTVVAETSDTAPQSLEFEDTLSASDRDSLRPELLEVDPDVALVLVVEDNADVRRYIRSYLQDSYNVMEATNGKEGVVKALESIPDLIISDIMMPIMDGQELCEKLKTDQKTSHIPIILLTAKAAPEDKLAGLETGADDYLTKPFDAEELQVRVKNLIEQRRKLREKWSQARKMVPDKMALRSQDKVFLDKAIAVVKENIADEAFTVETLGRGVGMSRAQLHRKLKALTNLSTSQFIHAIRLQRAAEMLEAKTGTVAEIAYAVGFEDPSYFTRVFTKKFGCSPSRYAQTHDSGSLSG